MIMSDNKGKSFKDLANGKKLDYSVLDLERLTNKFEEFFKSEEFLTGYDDWKEENDE